MRFVDRLFAYLDWADGVVFEVLSGVSAEEFSAPIGGYGRSLRDVCVHLAYDNWEWLLDVSGRDEVEPEFSAMGVDEVITFIKEMQGRWRRYVGQLDTESSVAVGKGRTVSVVEFVFHLVNHAAYHRGQLVLALRMLGRAVPMTDYVPFVVSQ